MPIENSTPYEETDSAADERNRGSASSAAPSKASETGSSATGSSAASSSTASSAATGDTPLGLRRSDRNSLRANARKASTSNISTSSSGAASSNRPASIGIARSTSAGPGIDQLVQKGLQDLETQRRGLQREIEQLERRKERLEAEMRSSFAGSSQEIAVRVQGFKDYLIGSLQDLATAAEQINLVSQPMVEAPAPQSSMQSSMQDSRPQSASSGDYSSSASDRGSQRDSQDGGEVSFAAQRFAQQRDRIHSLLDQYRTRPDYYGPPWQLRRTFEPIHAERVSNWFFTQGGRGSVKSVGSRLQNVLVASAAISCLYAIYDRRMCVLVLASTPERLGEWRRWLQDCLGVARGDFGTNRGIMLFESSAPMAMRAERLLDSGRLPFLIMDEAEEKVSMSLLQYPLWLGFARDPENPANDYDYY